MLLQIAQKNFAPKYIMTASHDDSKNRGRISLLVVYKLNSITNF